jgi:flagellar biosynthesis protein FliQ
MNVDQITDFAHRAMSVAAMLAVPILLVCLIVGLVVSIFETATQVHEQALAFVTKIAAVIMLLAIMGGWMVLQLQSFTREIFTAISNL